jgi:flagellar motor switch/type III secretory pathway protein FliN
MAELTPDIAAVVRAACETNADEAAGAFSRTLDAEISVSIGLEGACDLDRLPAGCDGPGLLVMLKFGPVGLLGILPEATGLLPEWYAEPDSTGQSKLTTLAQELSLLVVPEAFMADDFQAARVAHLGQSLRAAGVSSGAGLVPLTLAAGETRGEFHLIWPCTKPEGAFQVAREETLESESAEVAAATEESVSATTSESVAAAHGRLEDLEQLPPYTRSLLRIQVPVMVTLASKKQAIHQIVELGAGSIIKFEKSCEEMLELEVGGVAIAQGEAVKVGDKFGLRITSMILPGERFNKLSPKRRGA